MPVPTNLRHWLFITFAGFTACLIGGCEQGDAVRVYTAPKDPPAPQRPAAPRPVVWTLPQGWTEVADPQVGQFGRFATLQVSADDPTLTLAVHQLDGASAGDLTSNLNRWEAQLGLPPTPAADAEKKARAVTVDGHTGHRIDLTGAVAPKPQAPASEPNAQAPAAEAKPESPVPARMLGFILPHGEDVWSFKLQGPPDKVAAQEAAFDQFVASVRFTSHDHGPTTAGSGAAGGGAPVPGFGGAPPQGPPDDKTYTLKDVKLPAGWVEDPTPREMRFKTYNVGTGNEQATLIVTRLLRDRFGSVEQNIERWRGEVGLPPSTDVAKEQFRPATIGGEPAYVFDFAPPAPAPDARRSFVGIVPKGANVWFFKLIGPAKTVTEQQANFDAFLQSLQFGEAGE
jgi:hypothetical protein